MPQVGCDMTEMPSLFILNLCKLQTNGNLIYMYVIIYSRVGGEKKKNFNKGEKKNRKGSPSHNIYPQQQPFIFIVSHTQFWGYWETTINDTY